jgi:hypothetical protein
MTPSRDDWKNHAHWDHGAERPAAPPPAWETPALRRFLHRHHLPVHPGGPLALIVLGLGHCLLVGAVFATIEAAMPPLGFAALALLLFSLAPGIGLVVTGTWDLARRHWRPGGAR